MLVGKYTNRSGEQSKVWKKHSKQSEKIRAFSHINKNKMKN